MTCDGINVCFRSNVDNYEVKIYSNGKYVCRRIFNNKDILTIDKNLENISLIVSPLSERYNSTYYIKIQPGERRDFCFVLNFNKKSLYDTERNIFYLSDKTYGIPINGRLYFTSR